MGIIRSEEDKISLGTGKAIIRAFLALARFGEAPDVANPCPYGGRIEPVPETTAVRARQSINQSSVVNLFRATSIINAGRVAVRLPYNSYDEATEVMLDIVDAMETLLAKIAAENTDSEFFTYGMSYKAVDNSFEAIREYRTAFTKAMITLQSGLAKLVIYEVPYGVQSVLELAYDKYLDLDRMYEINEINGSITHPGFLPSGEEINILSK